MSSKLSLSFAVALALSIATAGCRAREPDPDQHRRSPRARGAHQHRYACRCRFPADWPNHSSDDARAQAGARSPPNPAPGRIGSSQTTRVKARAASRGPSGPIENQSLAVSPAASGMTGGSN